MTGAFTTNLKAMSLLALLVSTLLIYGAISFAVVQRRRVIGILRALGATRSEVLAIVLAEAAALGVVGASLGLLLGLAIGRELVTLVSQTINDLYFVVAVNETTPARQLGRQSTARGLRHGSRRSITACTRSCRQCSAARSAAFGAGSQSDPHRAQTDHRQCCAGGVSWHRGAGVRSQACWRDSSHCSCCV